MSLSRLPFLSLLTAAAAAIVSGDAELSRAFVMDRAAAANGEWWRYITGSLVHFSAWHLVLDVTTLLAAGLVIEARSRGAMATLLAFAGIGGTMAAMNGDAALDFFGGLSGVAFGAVVLAALMLRGGSATARMWGSVVLAVCAIKLAWELLLDRSMMSADGLELTIVAAAHATGAFAALVIVAGRRARTLLPVGLALVSACFPSVVEQRMAPAGVTLAATAQTLPGTSADDRRIALSFPLRVTVVFVAEEEPVKRGNWSFADPKMMMLSGAERTEITRTISDAVRRHPSVAEVTALAPLERVQRRLPALPRDSIGIALPRHSEVHIAPILADSATDLLLAIGYEQQQRVRDLWAAPIMAAITTGGLLGALTVDTSNTKEMMILLGGFLGGGLLSYMLPSQAHRTVTTVDVTGFHPRTGRVLFRIARSGQRRGVQSLMGFGGAMREEATDGISSAVGQLQTAIGEALTEFDRRVRATPDDFSIRARP